MLHIPYMYMCENAFIWHFMASPKDIYHQYSFYIMRKVPGLGVSRCHIVHTTHSSHMISVGRCRKALCMWLPQFIKALSFLTPSSMCFVFGYFYFCWCHGNILNVFRTVWFPENHNLVHHRCAIDIVAVTRTLACHARKFHTTPYVLGYTPNPVMVYIYCNVYHIFSRTKWRCISWMVLIHMILLGLAVATRKSETENFFSCSFCLVTVVHCIPYIHITFEYTRN